MTPPYEEIIAIMFSAMDQMRMAGHELNRCVWELSPSIRKTLFDNRMPGWKHDPNGDKVDRFARIPIRKGVSYESTGIMLKLVNSYWAG